MLDILQIAVAVGAIFLLPGAALLTLARRSMSFDWVEYLCLSLGLSLAVVPLALYATTLMGIVQNSWLVVGMLAMFALIFVWNWLRGGAIHAIEPTAKLEYGVLGLISLFTLFGRVWSMRGIEFPLWTDPYGHTVIAQLIVETGKLPTTYQPYAPIDDFTYHFGFHALSAWVHWVAGVSVPHSLVVAGQMINALVVPTTYIFVQSLFGRGLLAQKANSRRIGLMAALIVGLLSHMPVQIVNWGRYTQLGGQILLPVAVVLYLCLIRHFNTTTGNSAAKTPWRFVLLVALTFAGLFFAHYRIFLFGILLVILLFAFAYVWPEAGNRPTIAMLLNSIWVAVIGLVVLSPWIWRLAGGFGGNYARTVGNYQEEVHGEYFGFAFSELTDYGIQGYLWGLAVMGMLWGISVRERMAVILPLWIVGIFAGANLHLIGFTPLYSNTIVILALYLPLSALAAYFLSQVFGFVQTRLPLLQQLQRRKTLWDGGIIVLVLLLGTYGVWRDIHIVTPENGFVRQGDEIAMNWVRQNIDNDALFYIATSFWTPTVAHGLDGGYYLPLLAHRQTIMPLQNYASDGTMEYRTLVNRRLRDLADAVDAPTLAQIMRSYGISHVYVGVRDTYVNPQTFVDDPDDFELLYDQEGVQIFAVRAGEQP